MADEVRELEYGGSGQKRKFLVSLRFVLGMATFLLVTVAVLPVSLTIYFTAQATIDDTLETIMDQSSQFLLHDVQGILEVPATYASSNSFLFQSGAWDVLEQFELWRVFLGQARESVCGTFVFTGTDLMNPVFVSVSSNNAYSTRTNYSASDDYSISMMSNSYWNDSLIHMFRCQGVISSLSDATPIPNINISTVVFNPEFIIRAISSTELCWSNIEHFQSQILDDAGTMFTSFVIWAAVSAKAYASGLNVGVFLVQVTVDYITSMLMDMQYGERGFAFLTERSGLLVATSMGPAYSTGATERQVGFNCSYPLIAELMLELRNAGFDLDTITNRTSHRLKSSIDGMNYIVSMSSFAPFQDFDWILVISLPREDFSSDLDTQMLRSTVAYVAIIAAESVLAFFTGVLISRPLRRVGRFMDSIATLNLDRSSAMSISGSSRMAFSEIENLRQSGLVMFRSILSFMFVSSARFFSQTFLQKQKFVPATVVECLVRGRQEAQLGMKPCRCTVFFSDIEDFSGHCERQNVRNLLNQTAEYMTAMAEVISKNQGTLDKFVGDGIMAIWNAPYPVPNHELAACRAALGCKRALRRLWKQWKKRSAPPFFFRIGVHTGDVFVGNMGSVDRLNFTAVGQDVNTAARLEPLNKAYGTEIIISDAVQKEVKDEFLLRPLGRVIVQGSSSPMHIYELIDYLHTSKPFDLETVHIFSKAIDCIEEKNFETAHSLLSEYLSRVEDDVYGEELLDLCTAKKSQSASEQESWTFIRTVYRTLHSELGEATSHREEIRRMRRKDSVCAFPRTGLASYSPLTRTPVVPNRMMEDE